MTPEQLELLRQLISRVDRLAPDHRKPERFHEEKSDIKADLRKLLEGRA